MCTTGAGCVSNGCEYLASACHRAHPRPDRPRPEDHRQVVRRVLRPAGKCPPPPGKRTRTRPYPQASAKSSWQVPPPTRVRKCRLRTLVSAQTGEGGWSVLVVLAVLAGLVLVGRRLDPRGRAFVHRL